MSLSTDRLIIEIARITDASGRFIYNIENTITDFDIMEHIDKPYLTGIVTFQDNIGIYDTLQFDGTERFELSVRFPEDPGAEIFRTFIIDKIVNTVKNNDVSELISFHIVEDIAFISSILNVNKAYAGHGREIIESIFRDYLSGHRLSSMDYSQALIRSQVVVPNMRPLEACDWIKDRTYSENGTPFYLFSSLGQENVIHFLSLETMLNANIPDGNKHYVYSQAMASGAQNEAIAGNYLIHNYQVRKNADISDLVNKSLVGAVHEFWNVTYASPSIVNYNVESVLSQIGIEKSNFAFSNEYKHNGTKLSELESRKSYHTIASYAYFPEGSYREMSSYERLVTAKSLRNFLTGTNIDINVPGRNFLVEGMNRTLGNLINLKFLKNSINAPNYVDTKKSGKHLIYAARHLFKKEKYTVTLSCVKIEDLAE